MDINKLLCSEELMLGIEFGNRSGTFSANKSDDLDLKKANGGVFVTSTKKLNNIEILIRDTRLLHGGYVCNWDTKKFADYVLDNDKKGNVILSRDHGGPWQNSREVQEKLGLEKA